jgi:hypothetical protein
MKGLQKIKETLIEIETYKKDLEKKTPLLIKIQEKIVAVMTDI